MVKAASQALWLWMLSASATSCFYFSLSPLLNPPGKKGRCMCFHFIGQDVKAQRDFSVSREPAETFCVLFSMLLHFKQYVFYNIHFYNIHIIDMSIFLVSQSKIGCDLYYSSKKTEIQKSNVK